MPLPLPFSAFVYSRTSSSRSYHAGDYVRLYSWEQGPGASAGVLGLEISHGGQLYYLQFHPEKMSGVAERSLSGLMNGTKGGFINSFADAQLIEALRRNLHLLPSDITSEHFLRTMGDGEKLKLIQERNLSAQLLSLPAGKPTQTITLRTLDFNAMICQYYVLKSTPPLFAPAAGTVLHQANTENCATIIARVLHAGGANRSTSSCNDALGWVFLPILIWGVCSDNSGSDVLLMTLAAGLLGRLLGSMSEAWNAADAIGALMHREHKPYATSATWGLRLAGMAIAGVIGTLTPGSPTHKLLLLPDMLVTWAKQIEKTEQSSRLEVGRRMRA